MKKLLLASSLLCLLSLFACQRQKGPDGRPAVKPQSDQAIHHGGPDQARIDSLKAAKTKAKRAKAKQG